jgi:hypothetical protein
MANHKISTQSIEKNQIKNTDGAPGRRKIKQTNQRINVGQPTFLPNLRQPKPIPLLTNLSSQT